MFHEQSVEIGTIKLWVFRCDILRNYYLRINSYEGSDEGKCLGATLGDIDHVSDMK